VTIGFRHADTRVPFLWESSAQPAARWHGPGEGPCQYLADTPEGAWAEFLRHEEITDPADLAGIARSLWAIEVADHVLDGAARVADSDPDTLDPEAAMGGLTSYPVCQQYARGQRRAGADALIAPSAAVVPGGAGGQVTEGGLHRGPERDGSVWAIFGPHPDLPGHRVVEGGAPPVRVLDLVRPLTA
jgi:hypothetical protein